MQTTFALAALAAAAYAAPQAVTGNISPSSPAPAGCSPDYAGTFEITAAESQVLKRDINKRACGDPGSLVLSLAGGKLTDSKERTGYIASNFQFQFDDPPQAGAIYTAGFSLCNNGSLALGGSNVFYECISGSFYNLYDRNWAPDCKAILIDAVPCGSSGSVGQASDGQPTGTGIATVTEISDGQPQAPTGVVSQISDGQPQAPTGVVTEISDGQPQAPTGVVTEISDGQPQAPTGVVTEISDGQPQAPTGPVGPVITQISDGQPQAPTNPGGPVVTQISDGQPQAPFPTSTAAPTLPGASVGGTGPIGTIGTAPTVPSGSIGSTATVGPSGTITPSPVPAAANAVGGSMGMGALAVIAAAFL